MSRSTSRHRFPIEGRTVRVVGFDDAPFARRRGVSVTVLGAVCATTRFEGLLSCRARRDGKNATKAISEALRGSKFLPQLHLVLLDGIAVGGFNVIDLPTLAANVGLPCVAVMRKQPNMEAVEAAIRKLPRPEERLELLERAGPIHVFKHFVFQVQGADPEDTAAVLERVTDTGHVPEALRLAHLIGSGLMLGESTRRA